DEKEIPDAQIVGAVMPDYNVSAKSEVKLGVTVQSSVAQTAQITLRDNDGEEETTEVSLEPGVQTFEIAHTFAEQGLHRLSFDLSFKEPVEIEDAVEANNEYSSYLYMEVFDDILIVEGFEGEAEKLQELLKEEYTLTVLNVAETEKFPKTLDEMRLYDQVVLANVSHSDMPAGFEDLLNSYVKDIGGGLFTVGGSEPDGDEAHAYNRKDLYGTTYQDMLPVIAEDYTPPLGVVIIIDCSGSMSDVLENAKAGARACLNAMTERDYCGVIALDDDYKEALALTPVTREYEIVAAIDNIGNGGGTLLTPSLKRAGDSLKAQTNIEKRHIIVVSDCMFSDNVEKYGSVLQSNFEAGITISVVGINTSADSEKAGREIVKLGNGGSDDDSEEEAEKWKSKYHHTVTGEDLSSI
ncbi:MAG: VWA domain-containing protein, partial [Christensenellaceae bacterium]